MFKSPALQEVFINDCNSLFQSLFNLGFENKLADARSVIDRHKTKYINLYNVRVLKEPATAGKKLGKKPSVCPENTWILEGFTSGWENGMDDSSDNPYTCGQCNISFSTVDTLQEHKQQVHHNENEHPCHKCEKIFKSKIYLQKHVRQVHGDKKFTCELCGFVTTRKNQLKKHNETVHVNGQIQKCTKCTYTCYTRQELIQHMGAEHTIFYKCPACDQKFSRLDSRDHHYKLEHCTEKRYSCGQCGTKFSTHASLNRHEKTIHEGVKEFSCKDCQKSFTKSDALTAHISAIHFGEKPFSCPHCDKAFSQRGNLKKHVEVIHEGFKAFTCNQCAKACSTRSELNQHISVVHTKDELHACTQCDKKFFHKNLLRRHMKARHPEAVQDTSNEPRVQHRNLNRDGNVNTVNNANGATNANTSSNAANANTGSNLNQAIQNNSYNSPVNLNMNYMMTQQMMPYHLLTSGFQ